MLEDRYYMRRPSFRPRQSATVILIIANIAAFAVQSLVFGNSSFVYENLALSITGLKHLYLWQLLSFQFLHGGIWHLIFNCLAIFWFGRSVEDAVGRNSFIALYLSSGIIGGLVQSLVMLVFHQDVPVVGASAGCFGLVAAFAVLFPDTILMLMFIIPMPAKFLLLLEAAVAIAGIAAPNSRFFDQGVAHGAHLGGMISGLLFIRYAVHWRFRWPQISRPRARPLRRLVKVPAQKPGLWSQDRPETAEDLPPDEFLSKEVDPILDKISAHGIQSLTDRERRILEKARAKMAKR
jgi:membrane associated rhomboid family serine protease